MNSRKHRRPHGWFFVVSLAAVLCAFAFGVGGAGVRAGSHRGKKISPDLQKLLRESQSDKTINVIVRQNTSGGLSLNLDALLKEAGGRVARRFGKLGALSLSLPVKTVEKLAARSDVHYVSLDRSVGASGHVETTTGTDEVRTQTLISPLGIPVTTTLDGAGIGIAVVDSGVDAGHAALRDELGLSRVAASVDFTGENRTDDPYGHGTHVASIAAGSAQASGGAYTGVAPGARILNLRVLDAEGRGTASALLAALDWVMSNRALYNIRVVNLSLGTSAIESYGDDPVCAAVRRLVDAGVVVVAAAGNSGRDGMGNKIYGQIHSPGDEPSAITVGATNAFGTDARLDDTITTYSSRGPTRGSWMDDDGARHFDNLVKPDLVAPGNRIIAASAVNNHLVTTHPELSADTGQQPAARRQMYLSGTSMATPVAAGAAALVLQANSSLTPNLVKAVLMLTAQPLAGFNTLEQGAGEINVEGAVRLARLVRTDLSNATPLGSPLLTGATPATQTTVAGQTFEWSRGIVLNHTYAAGTDLFTAYQRIYGAGTALGDGVTNVGGQTFNSGMMTNGVALGAQLLTSDGSTFDGGFIFLDVEELIMGTLANGVMVGDGILVGDGVMVGDGTMVGDTTLQAQSAMVRGDETACMR